MTATHRSIYHRALGSDFDRLHPRIQERFGFSSADRVASIGTGVMEEIWHGAPYTLPFLYVGAWRRIMFPERGRNVPFRIENYAYVDRFGRETVTWCRTFGTTGRVLGFRTPRRFDAYMIYSERRRRIVDYLGSHQHLAVDLEPRVDGRGGLCIRSGAQRFYEGPIAFTFPMLFSGVAEVCEWYDDRSEKFGIEVTVKNPRWGPLFGYRGWFDAESRPLGADGVPATIRPLRQERRE